MNRADRIVLYIILIAVIGLIYSHMVMIRTLKQGAADVQNEINNAVANLPSWLNWGKYG